VKEEAQVETTQRDMKRRRERLIAIGRTKGGVGLERPKSAAPVQKGRNEEGRIGEERKGITKEQKSGKHEEEINEAKCS
jgi:hypothetical protein